MKLKINKYEYQQIQTGLRRYFDDRIKVNDMEEVKRISALIEKLKEQTKEIDL